MSGPAFIYDIFLSHNRAQKNWTRDLARRLREDGFQVWFDEWVLPKFAGRNWIDLITEGLEQSRKVTLIWSPEFFANDWPEFESSVIQSIDAVGLQSRVIPIMHTRCELPKKWAFREALDFVGCTHGTVEFKFRYHQLIYNLDNTQPFEPDFQKFKANCELPTANPEEIPPIGPLPKGSRMLHAPSKLFVGREKELRKLARNLRPSAETLVGVQAAVTGMGGVGKTQLAIEYAHRYGHRYPGGVFWLNMESVANTINEVAACGGPEGMGLPSFHNVKMSDQAACVLKQWQEREQPCLLIFDNAEDPELVKHWRPASGRCSVLITSRRPEWPLEMGILSLPIEILPRANSLEMLRKARPSLHEDPTEAQMANKLCEQLGDLPLGLQVATSYLQQYRTELIQDYLEDFFEASRTNPSFSQTWACFELSYSRLRPTDATDALALQLFYLSSHFAPVSIGRDFLVAAIDVRITDREHNRKIKRSLSRLEELGLITQDLDGNILLHPLVRQFARTKRFAYLTDDDASQAVAFALLRVFTVLNNNEMPQFLTDGDRVHLRELACTAEAHGDDGEWDRLASMCYVELIRHAELAHLWDEAKDDCEHLLRIIKMLRPTLLPSVLLFAARIFKEGGDTRCAKEYLNRCLDLLKASHGPFHSECASALHALAKLHHGEGNLEQSRLCYLHMLRVADFNGDWKLAAESLDDISSLLWDLGNSSGARVCIARALTIVEAFYGSEHSIAGKLLGILGNIWRNERNYEAAKICYERELKIADIAHGSNSLNVGALLLKQGALLNEQQDMPGARSAYERALSILERCYPLTPALSKLQMELSDICKKQGDFEEAMRYQHSALAIDKQINGVDYPAVATEVNEDC